MKPIPITVCAKDIMRINGKGNRTAQRLLAAIRKKNNKPVKASITILELSVHLHISVEEIQNALA